MSPSRLSRSTRAFKIALASTLVLSALAMTAKSAEAADIGSNDSVNTYGQTTEFIDHDLNTVVTLDRTKLPGDLGSTTFNWNRTKIEDAEEIEWARTVQAQKKLRQATGWDVANPAQRTRLINELTYVSRALDNDLKRGSKSQINLPKEKAAAALLYTVVRNTGTHTDCRGRCLKYTYRSVSMTTVLTLVGAAAGAGFFGASIPVIVGVTAAAGILCYLMDTFFQMRKAQASLNREIVNRRESAQAQHYVNAFILKAAEEGIKLGVSQMQTQLDAMAARINRVEASVTSNSQVDLRP